MEMKTLNLDEQEQVFGGALPTQFVVSNKSFTSLLSNIKPGGSIASVCQCVNCCSHSSALSGFAIRRIR